MKPIGINDKTLDPPTEWVCGSDIQQPSDTFLNTTSPTPFTFLIRGGKVAGLSLILFSAFLGGNRKTSKGINPSVEEKKQQWVCKQRQCFTVKGSTCCLEMAQSWITQRGSSGKDGWRQRHWVVGKCPEGALHRGQEEQRPGGRLGSGDRAGLIEAQNSPGWKEPQKIIWPNLHGEKAKVRLFGTLSHHILKISIDGDSTASLGRLCQ